MEGKIALFNADGTQIGDTFVRRARQLVKQQRATWVDDNHTAIRFNHDRLDAEIDSELAHSTTDKSTGYDRLYALAEIRIRDRQKMKRHLILVIPIFIAILIVTALIGDAMHGEPAFLFFGFASGVLATFNVYNIWLYYDRHIRDQRHFAYLKTRREMLLDAEVEKLRRMGYDE